MFPISYRRHGLPPTVIQHAVWLYLGASPLSYRDVEELLAYPGLDLLCEHPQVPATEHSRREFTPGARRRERNLQRLKSHMAIR